MAPILTLLESEQMRVHSRHIARRHASHRGGFDLTTTLHHFFNSYSKTYGSLDAVIILMLVLHNGVGIPGRWRDQFDN